LSLPREQFPRYGFTAAVTVTRSRNSRKPQQIYVRKRTISSPHTHLPFSSPLAHTSACLCFTWLTKFLEVGSELAGRAVTRTRSSFHNTLFLYNHRARRRWGECKICTSCSMHFPKSTIGSHYSWRSSCLLHALDPTVATRWLWRDTKNFLHNLEIMKESSRTVCDIHREPHLNAEPTLKLKRRLDITVGSRRCSR
jgi:hypothetical protein